MADVEIMYCTREQVQMELGYADSWRLNKRVDAKIRQASRDTEGLCHRKFYPWTGTRSFDLPETDSLFLYENELTSVDAISSGGTAMATTDYILRPESGPPYGWIDVHYGGSVGWQAAGSFQQAIAVTGTFGYPIPALPGGELAAGMSGADTVLTLASSAMIGVGSLILIGAERLVITEKTLTTTTATLAGDLTASKAQVQVAVSDGDLIDVGETIAIDGERMLVESILGDVLTVIRGQNGSTLAAHTTGAAVLAPRIADVARGQLGTVSAAHDADTPIYLLTPPSLVQEYTLALAVAALEHGSSGYARETGANESRRSADSRNPLTVLGDDLRRVYGRKARGRAI